MVKEILADQEIRMRNPFRDALVTELLERVDLFKDMFSDNILVGEAFSVFQPKNVILLGPQGCGKSMILNLTRLRVLAQLSLDTDNWPKFLTDDVPPFFGISINLTRANFSAFGKRSISKMLYGNHDPIIETAAASDFLSHFLFKEFLSSIKLIGDNKFLNFSKWLGLTESFLHAPSVPQTISKWKCWKDHYKDCNSWELLKNKCEERLEFWRGFLNTDVDVIPKNIWENKTQPYQVLHSIGNFLREASSTNLSLFVYIDQYETLCELNRNYGTELQRLINSLIKLRDPVVFFKVGARTYDWGRELRVIGSESIIELERDYSIVNLADVLIRNEDRSAYIYQDFAIDVWCRRLRVLHGIVVTKNDFKNIFGKWNAFKEADLYFLDKSKMSKTIKAVSEKIKNKIIKVCSKDDSPLVYRLASSWALQKVKRKWEEDIIISHLEDRPWENKWWFKERKEIGLVQVASHANQKRRYFGWDTICYLSGGNISIFLMLCSEIWDVSSRQGLHPLYNIPLDIKIQSEGILRASLKWRERDRNEPNYGSHRYLVINKIGTAINNSIRDDLSLSNPGHTGFSILESELYFNNQINKKVRKFIEDAVSWGIFEERRHRSKNKKDSTRRKYYLHPLLSPNYEIPIKRVKEPYYTDIKQLYKWLFSDENVDYGRKKKNLKK